jgi:hypothetical protein
MYFKPHPLLSLREASSFEVLSQVNSRQIPHSEAASTASPLRVLSYRYVPPRPQEGLKSFLARGSI